MLISKVEAKRRRSSAIWSSFLSVALGSLLTTCFHFFGKDQEGLTALEVFLFFACLFIYYCQRSAYYGLHLYYLRLQDNEHEGEVMEVTQRGVKQRGQATLNEEVDTKGPGERRDKPDQRSR